GPPATTGMPRKGARISGVLKMRLRSTQRIADSDASEWFRYNVSAECGSFSSAQINWSPALDRPRLIPPGPAKRSTKPVLNRRLGCWVFRYARQNERTGQLWQVVEPGWISRVHRKAAISWKRHLSPSTCSGRTWWLVGLPW